jgi:2-polyprenyl-6-methoxyphenol hydroxylase-like FAD-dependent oxidoreductase
VVVGAGLGGLAVAGGLARAGWQVTLLERADRLRAEPTALVLWPGGVRALRALGLGGGLAAIATEVPEGGLRRPDGRWLRQPGPPRPEPAVLVHAQDLHDALIAGLGDDVEIRTGVRVRRLLSGGAGGTRTAVPGARPAVTDRETTWEADLVVAADGTDSALRPAVAAGSAPVSAGVTAWRAVIPWYRAPGLPADQPVGGETSGRGYRFVSASLGERGSAGASRRGGLYWCATVPGAPRPEPAATQLDLLRRWYAGWHPPVGELLAATEPGDLVQRELRALHPLPGRYAVPAGPGGVVLLGDAGHALADHLGLGACLAFEDAATLVAVARQAVPGRQLTTAIDAYDRLRRPRLARAARVTRLLGPHGPAAELGPVRARRLRIAADVAGQWLAPE